MFDSEKANLRVTIVGAQGLYKSDRFSFPNPFAVLTINSEQERRTSAVDKAVAPYWNETFDVIATTFSILTIRVFDQKKFEKKGSGFLGVVNFSVSSVFDSDARESKIVEKDLQISKNGELVSHGKLVVQLSWIAPSAVEDHPASTHRAFTKAPIGLAVSAAQSRMVREWAKPPQQVVASGARGVDGLDRTQAPPVEHNQAVIFSGATSQDASLAWTRKYGESHINLELEDPAPFTTTRRLGGGGIGIVYETQLDGFALALKTTYTPRLTDEHLNEIKILSRISATRHKHIVGLIGSYVHRQRRGYELGLLIWPVAHCDLSLYLKDIDALGSHLRGTSAGMLTAKRDSVERTALDNLCIIGGVDLKLSVEALTDNGKAIELYERSSEVLRTRLGCIANAVAWLHREGIRHKDLKPSQILLSPGGLWLTDFGWSKDISELAQSTTSEGDNITLKYQSPERAQKKPCGRPEDIFALGCIFLEMVYQLVKTTVPADQTMAPWQQKGWYFQAHIDQEYELLGDIKGALLKLGYGVDLFELIVYMLVVDPEDRPTIDEVVGELASNGFSCCTSESQRFTHDNFPLNDLDMSLGRNHSAPPVAPEYSQLPTQGLQNQSSFSNSQQYNPTYTYHGHHESASPIPFYHQPVGTVTYQNIHNHPTGTTSNYNDNNSSTTTLLRPASSTPSLDASLSNLQLMDSHITAAYPPPPRDPGQIPRANTFTTTPARMSSNRMMLKKAISSLDRQLNVLRHDDNKLRNLMVAGRSPAVPPGAQVSGQSNSYKGTKKGDGEN